MIGYNKMLSKQYLPWIDVAKGIGIILVVLGHSMFPKHILISGFHMPLFFILAGITFSENKFYNIYIQKDSAHFNTIFFLVYIIISSRIK